MLLEADVLTYDQAANTVSASGRVRIEYGGNRLVAERVIYDRKTSRLKAVGNVELIQSDGTKFYTQEADVTDDFADGFANQLRAETVDKTYFAAESADRKGGKVTTFYNGVYTACEPCEEKPNKAPIWRVKSRKTIWDGPKKTIRFEGASFEMFGLPLAYFPAFEVPDPTVKRKSGFLFPGISYNSKLGVGVHIPYYFALAPTYDLTVTSNIYHMQGFVPEAEWRQRFNNGEYSIKAAGVYQLDPEAFDAYSVDRSKYNVLLPNNTNGPGDPNRLRGMIGSKGRFEINPRWTFGWNVLLQSDKNFSRTYDIGGYSNSVFRNETYLTGLGERNYFDLRFMKFDVQETYRDDYPTVAADRSRDGKQPWVLPSFDYSRVSEEPVAGGELNIDFNARIIRRSELDAPRNDPDFEVDADGNITNGPHPTSVSAIRGLEGTDGRLTGEAEWRRTLIAPGGLTITPILHVQGEARMADYSSASSAAILDMAAWYDERTELSPVAADIRSEWYRYMATAGLDVRWPVLFSTTSSTHILEPVAQIFARPDEQDVDGLGLSNEDAQSFVFDATTLFERDKFSGYDRMEGGTRANLGIRYSGSYANGWSTQALFGQSYHLAGLNSYASPDLVHVGIESGLENDRSDYVAMAGFISPNGLSASASGRFDEETFDARRLEARAALTGSGRPISVTAKYAFIEAQPNYGQPNDRHEVTLGGRVKMAQYWQVFGSGTYDLQQDYMAANSFGFGYADECFTFALTYSQTHTIRTDNTRDTTEKVGFQLSFRTLGDFGNSTAGFN